MALLVGITGGIGSGKSTIAHNLEQMGYPVYFTDSRAKQLMTSSHQLRQQLVSLLGEDVYENNVLNKTYLAQQIFEKGINVDYIIHPAVFSDMQEWLRAQSSPFAFAESAILFESGMDRLCDVTVCVCAPLSVRIVRTMMRDHISREQVHARIEKQMSDEERASRSNLCIRNDGTIPVSQLTQQIVRYLQKKEQ